MGLKIEVWRDVTAQNAGGEVFIEKTQLAVISAEGGSATVKTEALEMTHEEICAVSCITNDAVAHTMPPLPPAPGPLDVPRLITETMREMGLVPKKTADAEASAGDPAVAVG